MKLALMPSTQRRLSELQRMHTSDRGYDFYKQMKFAAKGVTLGEIDPAVILKSLESIKRPSERTHNLQMATNFLEWWKSQTNVKPMAVRPQGIYRTEGMRFGIKMRPELAYEQDGALRVVYLWATKAPAMNNQIAGAGLQLLREKLGGAKFENATFSILNLRTKRLMTESLVSNQSKTIAAAEIAIVNELWKSVS